ncbi:MAG TPA: HEAT repeat domain-containing protein [Bryobacteraceae bacterium]|nr:HEAT repeat domain-containing protein [Bryobacteraceae bacterium]
MARFRFGFAVMALGAAWVIVPAVAQVLSNSIPASAGILAEHELQDIDRMPPQQQAERLLERAISRYQGAIEQIDARLAAWAGKLTYSKKMQAMLEIAWNSSDLRVRTAAVELSLASYGLAKEPAQAEQYARLIKSETSDRPWRLWMLSLLANRGVETESSKRLLLEFIHDPNVETRQWAVNSLSMVGTDDVIEPLLEVLGRDPSPEVRERAGCGLAESGMMTREQRKKAIPGLLRLMDDPTLDRTTQNWVFQALREISGQDFGQDHARWRDWQARQP